MGAVPPKPRHRKSTLGKDFWDKFNSDMEDVVGSVDKTIEEVNKMCGNIHSDVGNRYRSHDPKTGMKRVRCGCGAVHIEGFPCHYCKAQPGSEERFVPINPGPNSELNATREEIRRDRVRRQSEIDAEMYRQKSLNKNRLGDLAVRYDIKQTGNIAGGDIVGGDLIDRNGSYWALDTLLYAFGGAKPRTKIAPAVTKGGAKRKLRALYQGQRRFWRTLNIVGRIYYWWYGEEDVREETPIVPESDSESDPSVDTTGEDLSEQTESTEVQDVQLALSEDEESVPDAGTTSEEDQVHERTDS